MTERSFRKEVEKLRVGAGEEFAGEGILAITKALLQSGVAYVGGYQGSPISHLMDVLSDAQDILGELGVHFEASANEATAAAMAAASVNYPLRGAITFKSTVGTNVASDALANLSSGGVTGGVVVIVGEDYGEGSSIMQERTHAFAMKSQMWLIDPRPNVPNIVRSVEHAFRLSEASNTPVFLLMRIRSCHVHGRFIASDNVRPSPSLKDALENPRRDLDRIVLPPASFLHEHEKVDKRWPAAVDYVRENKLNEVVDGPRKNIGIIVQGGIYNTLIRTLERLGLANTWGDVEIPLYVLNVQYPLVDDEIAAFCRGKRAVLLVEEGQPNYLEQAIDSILRKSDCGATLIGKDVFPRAGEYTSQVLRAGIVEFLGNHQAVFRPPQDPVELAAEFIGQIEGLVPPRPPGLCTGCPERPVFSAIKILEREIGRVHIAADIGCHALATFEPFSMGNSILGYGMSLASAAAVAPFQQRRSISIMGDGGFWHNGLATGVIGTLLNEGDSVLIIMQNGFTSATGQQYIPSSASGKGGRAPGMEIEATLRALNVPWLRRVRTYSIAEMIDALREALTTDRPGLKVIIADGECQLARQRRLRGENAERLARQQRVALPRFGVDDEICTGDHSCIRLSGCPSLTVKPNPDPLRDDPVATIIESCVGCGVCGEVAHAAALCPSFYRADRTVNAGPWERGMARLRRAVIGAMGGGR